MTSINSENTGVIQCHQESFQGRQRYAIRRFRSATRWLAARHLVSQALRDHLRLLLKVYEYTSNADDTVSPQFFQEILDLTYEIMAANRVDGAKGLIDCFNYHSARFSALAEYAVQMHIEGDLIKIQPEFEEVDESELPPLVDASTEWEEVSEMPPLEAVNSELA